jgi:hypothetical protein
MVSAVRDGEKHSRFGSWWLARIESKEGGVAPASLPLFRIWDITHPGRCPRDSGLEPSGGVGHARKPKNQMSYGV